MSKPTNGEAHDGAGEVTATTVPTVVVTIDPATMKIGIACGGHTMEYAKAILQMACDELERAIVAQRSGQAVQPAPPFLLKHLARR